MAEHRAGYKPLLESPMTHIDERMRPEWVKGKWIIA